MTIFARTVAASILFAAGQMVLLVLGPRTRAAGTFVTADGISLLAPDSRTYLSIAESPASILAQPWTRWGYPLALYLGELAGLGPSFVVAVQAVVLVIAAVLLHTMTAEVAGERSGLIAAAILLVNPLTAQWVRFALTETFMLAGVIAAVWFGTRRALADHRGHAVGLVGVGVLLSVLRPNGVLVLGAGVAVLVLARSEHLPRGRRSLRVAAVWAVTVALLGASAVVSGPPAEGSITAQLYSGVVIEGTEEVRTSIPMPAPADATDESVRAAVRFALGDPLAVARLAMTRVVVELAQVRPHYPIAVNLAVGSAMAFLLIALLLGATDARARRLREVGITVALPLLLLIGATFAVPEGRYGWAPLVALLPLAGVGAERVLAAAMPTTARRGATR